MPLCGTDLVLNASTNGQECPTLTFTNPIAFVNHPHLTTVLQMKVKDGDWLAVDGVTNTLRQT